MCVYDFNNSHRFITPRLKGQERIRVERKGRRWDLEVPQRLVIRVKENDLYPTTLQTNRPRWTTTFMSHEIRILEPAEDTCVS
jgi:hypothetical protein